MFSIRHWCTSQKSPEDHRPVTTYLQSITVKQKGSTYARHFLHRLLTNTLLLIQPKLVIHPQKKDSFVTLRRLASLIS